MIYLVLHVVTLLLFLQSLRVGQWRKSNIPAMAAVNYVVAAGLSWAVVFMKSGSDIGQVHWGTVLGGIANGLIYALNFVVIIRSYKAVGVGITVTATGMGSAVLPVLLAWLIWAEPIAGSQWLALGLFLPAVVLMRPGQTIHPNWSLRSDLLLAAVLGLTGAANTIHKAVGMASAEGSREVYQACLFTSAAVVSVGLMLLLRGRPRREDYILGVLAGLFNAAATFFIVLAVSVLKAAVVYPTVSSSSIGLNLLVSRLVWSERLRWRQILGVALAVGVILLGSV